MGQRDVPCAKTATFRPLPRVTFALHAKSQTVLSVIKMILILALFVSPCTVFLALQTHLLMRNKANASVILDKFKVL